MQVSLSLTFFDGVLCEKMVENIFLVDLFLQKYIGMKMTIFRTQMTSFT